MEKGGGGGGGEGVGGGAGGSSGEARGGGKVTRGRVGGDALTATATAAIRLIQRPPLLCMMGLGRPPTPIVADAPHSHGAPSLWADHQAPQIATTAMGGREAAAAAAPRATRPPPHVASLGDTRRWWVATPPATTAGVASTARVWERTTVGTTAGVASTAWVWEQTTAGDAGLSLFIWSRTLAAQRAFPAWHPTPPPPRPPLPRPPRTFPPPTQHPPPPPHTTSSSCPDRASSVAASSRLSPSQPWRSHSRSSAATRCGDRCSGLPRRRSVSSSPNSSR